MRANLPIQITPDEIDRLKGLFPNLVAAVKYKLKQNCCDPKDFGFCGYEITMPDGSKRWFEAQ